MSAILALVRPQCMKLWFVINNQFDKLNSWLSMSWAILAYIVQLGHLNLRKRRPRLGWKAFFMLINKHFHHVWPTNTGKVCRKITLPGEFTRIASWEVREKLKYSLTHSPWQIWIKFYICSFQNDFRDWWLTHLLWNCTNMNVTGLHWWSVNIGSGNGLVKSGNKPLPEPILTQIFATIWRHLATMSWRAWLGRIM